MRIGGEWLREVLQGDALGVAILASLTLALAAFGLRAILPHALRARLRTPAALSLVALSICVGALLLPVGGLARRALATLAGSLLLLAGGRLFTVFAIDFVWGRKRAAPRIVRDIVEGVLVLVAVLVVLRVSGVEASSLLTTSALITAIVGLSLQDTLGNLIAGLSLQVQQPFSMGEWVQLDREGFQLGEVLEINWRATRLRTQDDVELVVPNAQLARAVVTNHSRPTRAVRRNVFLTLACELPTRRVQEVLSKSIASVPGVLAEPPTSVVTHAFLDLGVQYAVRYYIDAFARREAIDAEVHDRLWYALQRANLPLASTKPRPATPEGEGHDDERHPDPLAAIRGVDFLQDLPDDALEALARGTRVESYQPGEIVVRQGELGGELYLCLSGELIVVHTPARGSAREVARLHHGGMFGELALMTGEPRTATVQAVQTCELAVIARSALAQVLTSSSAFADLISQRMAERQAALDAIGRDTSPEQQRASVAQHKQRFLRRLREFFAL